MWRYLRYGCCLQTQSNNAFGIELAVRLRELLVWPMLFNISVIHGGWVLRFFDIAYGRLPMLFANCCEWVAKIKIIGEFWFAFVRLSPKNQKEFDIVFDFREFTKKRWSLHLSFNSKNGRIGLSGIRNTGSMFYVPFVCEGWLCGGAACGCIPFGDTK